MIFQINTIVIPTVLLFSLFLFIASKKIFLHVKDRSPLALGYLYLLSFVSWWISPFFPFRWQDNPFQGNSLLVAVLAGSVLCFVVFRFLLGLRWAEAALGLALFILAHVIAAAAKLFFLTSYRYQEGLDTVVTGLRTFREIKNLMSWAWMEAGVTFLVFLVIFRLFSDREEAGSLMSSPLWHFSVWISALVLWDLLWVYEMFFDIPIFLQRYFLIYILQIFLIAVLCVPFFRWINRIPLPVAGRMAWSFLFANFAGLGFRFMLLIAGASH
jgi:hypothetical protein